ncbi:DUF2076 family protein [Dechloromonas sp. XY25]|uniref:DUF2076 family protein n=1 Tax=Dechloromonas hankyongensis TaxID=2908002 RepID=A0ABS9K4N4_9RHOO|nr:DUF2076 family protein [Dechloromonas hankyongensis]MCG2578134.1 DUF2076 family protein [Dechloromonas hankyongensis]
MNTQEREQLTTFLSGLTAAQASHKDSEAEALIRQAVERQPDAAYLLVQKAFLLEQAVGNSQRRIEQLQGELETLRSAQPRPAFADTGSWGNSSPRMPAMTPAVPAAPVQPVIAPSWGNGWLSNVATTAAGVAAGAFLFQGIEHLVGHHDSNSLFGGNSLSSQPSETVVNNFFGSDRAAVDSDDFSGLSDGLAGSDDSSWI